MVENANFVPVDSSVAKKVWYGIGKAMESQSPKAWEKRILRVIDEKIIPKLSPENQQWMAEVRPKVEKFAKVAGVAVPVIEVVAVVGSTVVIGKKIGEKIRIHKHNVIQQKLREKYGGFGEPTLLPVAWATDARSISHMDAAFDRMAKNAPATPFTKWLRDITIPFTQSYGPIEAYSMEKTMRELSKGITGQGKGSTRMWRDIVETAQKGTPQAIERAKRSLEKVFSHAYVQAHGGAEAKNDPEKTRQLYEAAKKAFTNWDEEQFVGLPQLPPRSAIHRLNYFGHFWHI